MITQKNIQENIQKYSEEKKYQMCLRQWVIQDFPDSESQELPAKYEILERYYNDIYKLFLAKLTMLERTALVGDEEKKRLKQLLDEIIYVKTLLEGE